MNLPSLWCDIHPAGPSLYLGCLIRIVIYSNTVRVDRSLWPKLGRSKVRSIPPTLHLSFVVLRLSFFLVCLGALANTYSHVNVRDRGFHREVYHGTPGSSTEHVWGCTGVGMGPRFLGCERLAYFGKSNGRVNAHSGIADL